MTESPVVRKASAADISAITRIYAHAVENGVASFELEPPDQAEMHNRQQAIIDAGFPYLVAEIANEVVGYTYVSSWRPRPAYQWCVESTIYVTPEKHGAGIGRALLTKLIGGSENCGFRQMIAVIGGADHVPSIELHRALGFEVIGHLKKVGWKFDHWHDSIIMQRSLGSGNSEPPETATGS